MKKTKSYSATAIEFEYHLHRLIKYLHLPSRIAMMTMDYHDYCQAPGVGAVSDAEGQGGKLREKSGIADFTFRLLERSGYRILEVPYSEFGVNEKLLRRVQCLEARLKKIHLGAEPSAEETTTTTKGGKTVTTTTTSA